MKLTLLLGIAIYGLVQIDWAFGPLATTSWKGASLDSWTLCLLFSVFAYSGWNAAIYAASEFREPQRTVPRAMFIGATIVIVLYVLLNLAIVGNLSNSEIAGVEAIVAKLVQQLFGHKSSVMFALVVSLALLSSIGVSSFAGPRVLHGILIRNATQEKLASTTPIPASLVWGQACISIALILTGSFEQILSLMGVFLGVAPVFMVLGMYRKSWDSELPSNAVRFAVAPLFIISSIAIISISLWSNPQAALFVFALFVLSGIIAMVESKAKFWLKFEPNK